VNYYMKSYADNGMLAHVGYEIGIPAYPAYDHDPTNQLPLIQSELTGILAAQGSKGGFFWELYKAAGNPSNLDAVSAAQQICKAALGANTPRCSGVIPSWNGPNPTSVSPSPGTPTTEIPTTTIPTTCSSPAWSASVAYNGGAQVSYNGRLYSAQWWSQGNVPTDGLPWKDVGACGGGPTVTPNPGSCAGVNA
ncbi:hypothetical protein BGZ50_003100, partial [Haplosporangium sp. Z 11]